MLNVLELDCRKSKLMCLQSLLYLCQGTFDECKNEYEHSESVIQNCLLLYNCGVFSVLIEQFVFEIELGASCCDQQSTNSSSIVDNIYLRVIANIIYTLMEVFRTRATQHPRILECIKDELQSENVSGKIFSVVLFDCLVKFCNVSSPYLPMKKILLLLWKTLLITFGDLNQYSTLRNGKRIAYGLLPITENYIEMLSNMKPWIPKPVISDLSVVNSLNYSISSSSLENALNIDISNSQNVKDAKKLLNPQSNIIRYESFENLSSENLDDKESTLKKRINNDMDDEDDGVDNVENNNDTKADHRKSTFINKDESIEKVVASSKANKPNDDKLSCKVNSTLSSSFVWRSKIRLQDLKEFLNNARRKFVGFAVKDDLSSLEGLPKPIHESIKYLKMYLYQSHTEMQVNEMELSLKYPFTHSKDKLMSERAVELFYCDFCPKMDHYTVSLLKLLLSAFPVFKNKNETSLSIFNDVAQCDKTNHTNNNNTNKQPIIEMVKKEEVDKKRHNEIVSKAISAIILLLLKYFKINHVYQFEGFCQQLVFANCVPLFLKFLNQDMPSSVFDYSTLPSFEYPHCLFISKALISDNEEEASVIENEILASLKSEVNTPTTSWRKMFFFVNIVRILNKLVKWKPSRITLLINFNTTPILKRCLRVCHSYFQFYVFKLLKLQMRYLGRPARKNNTQIMTAIYHRLRHVLNDDWAYGNLNETKEVDFQAEEGPMKLKVEAFHAWRDYSFSSQTLSAQLKSASCNSDDDNRSSCEDRNTFGQEDEEEVLSQSFKNNYRIWLENEVYNHTYDWDRLLASTDCCF